MEITSVRVRRFENNESRVRGIASVTIDEAFLVNDIRIIEGDNGLFIAMPSRKNKKDDTYRDIAHPLNQETRTMFEKAIFSEYEKEAEASESEAEEE